MSKYFTPIFALNRERRHLAGISRSKELAGKDAGAATACFRGLLCNFFRGVLILFVLALAGCTLAPTYHRPSAPISSSWPKVPGHPVKPTVAAAVPAADIGWREFFRDPRLQQLIELALTNNLDLRVAMLNVDQTRALYHVQRDALVPTVDINANGSRQRIPFGFAGNGSSTTYNNFNVNLGVASYELDLFGRVRSLKKQALETYFATEEAQKSAQITLVAEVGAAYLTEREATEQLAVARQTLKAARTNYDLTQRSYDAGVLSELDLNVAETQWQTARAAVAGYEQQLAEAQDYLVLLVGCPLPDDLAPPRPFDPQICLSDIPAGLPSDLIAAPPGHSRSRTSTRGRQRQHRRRPGRLFPDHHAHRVRGAPPAPRSEGLFAPGSQAWSFSPQIVWPIFAAGTAWHELQAVKAAKLIEVANYQKAIQTAFREVADALAVRATVKTQLSANRALVKSDQQTYQLTEARFHGGVDSSLNVLTTQQALYNARQNLIQTEYSRLFNLINLYQALGGGWQEHTVQPKPAPH